MKIPQTRRRWTPSSTSRSLAVAPQSVTWWWVSETIIFVDVTNVALQLFRLCFRWATISFHLTLPQVSVTQQYETNTVSNKKKRTLHHIGFAVYEVPPNMTRLSPQYVLEHVSQNLFFSAFSKFAEIIWWYVKLSFDARKNTTIHSLSVPRILLSGKMLKSLFFLLQKPPEWKNVKVMFFFHRNLWTWQTTAWLGRWSPSSLFPRGSTSWCHRQM